MMRTLWLDTTAGVAGDMVLAALVDAGVDLSAVQAAVDAVVPGSVRLRAEAVTRQGQRATKVHVDVLVDDPPHRRWATIREQLASSGLAQRTRDLALATFARLAEAEARVHGIDADEVHFHEVGALDSIADVVGSCEALRLLDVDEVVGTAVAVGEGRVRVAHGLMPVPVPAVAQLALGWPTISGALTPERRWSEPSDPSERRLSERSESKPHDHPHPHEHSDEAIPRPVGELATPTGMALVRAFATRWGPQPDLVTEAVGVGAGTKDTPGRPNVVRVLSGTAGGAQATSGLASSPADATPGTVAELQANVDDLDPRLWPGVLDRLLDAGAVDAWVVPILMKRGRPAHTLHVLCRPEEADDLSDVVFATTTTLGVRRHAALHRSTLERTWTAVSVTVSERTHEARIKIAHRSGAIVQATPEFVDVARVADESRVPELDVLRAAEAAAVGAGLVPGAAWPR